MFYHYRQNNPGGDFIVDKHNGIAPYVIIEGNSADEANSRAWIIGLEFYDEDADYERTHWLHACESDANVSPLWYGQPLGPLPATGSASHLKDPDVAVHYLDGRIEPTCRAFPVLQGAVERHSSPF